MLGREGGKQKHIILNLISWIKKKKSIRRNFPEATKHCLFP